MGAFPGSYYIELQRAGFDGDEAYTQAAMRLAAEAGLPVVATHPVQFLDEHEFQAHEARVCIAEGEILANPRRVRRFTKDQYLLSSEEMHRRYADVPSALANTVEIAKRCNLSLVLGKPRLPNFPARWRVAGRLPGAAVRAGPGKAPGLPVPGRGRARVKREQYYERLRWECKTIIQMGFPGYFLIVQDFINWGKNNGVPVGPGRGSGAGSLVAYALGITDLDPIRYDLLFERFLNPERVSARLRYRLLPGQPRTRHRLRQGKIRARGREPDRHLRHAGRQGRGARRRPGAGHALCSATACPS